MGADDLERALKIGDRLSSAVLRRHTVGLLPRSEAELAIALRKLVDLTNAQVSHSIDVGAELIRIVFELKDRLSRYECPEHAEPQLGSCDTCDAHDGWNERRPCH